MKERGKLEALGYETRNISGGIALLEILARVNIYLGPLIFIAVAGHILGRNRETARLKP